MHAGTALVIVLVAAAVGWFMPLLGITLIGFMAVDPVDRRGQGPQLGEARLKWLPAYMPVEVHRLVGGRTYTRDA